MAATLSLASQFTSAGWGTQLLSSGLKWQYQQRSLAPRSQAFRVLMMGESDPVREWILGEGAASKITKISPVGGGCISVASRYDTDVGSFFVKTYSAGPSMFEAEAAGLSAMFNTKTIRVPKPLKVGSLPRRGSYIIMEFIEFGSSKFNSQVQLGRKLGEMHRAGTSDKGFGFDMDNTIGSTPQPNPWTEDWVTFFADRRLGYQLELAKKQYGDSALYEKGQRLLKQLPSMLGGLDIRPCLLHGDLWSGNIACDKEGEPVILDPACYYGHNEAEFGMSWCASFGTDFYNAYFEVMPKQQGFEQRMPLYKLYHYLNHYNLFGSGYRSSCMSIIKDYL